MSSGELVVKRWRLLALPVLSALYAGACVDPNSDRTRLLPHWELDLRAAICAMCLTATTSLILLSVGAIKQEK